MTLLLLSFAAAQDSGDPCAATAPVKLNELLVNPPSTDDGNEWVELTSAETTSLDGWSLEWGTSSYNKSAALSGELVAGDHLVVGGIDVPFADLALSDFESIGNAGSNADSIRLLRCDGSVSDILVYGDENSDGWVDEAGATVASLAPKAGESDSIARALDDVDTDDNGVDFCLEEEETSPGAPNRDNCQGPPDTNDPSDSGSECAPAEGITVNEVLPDPDGSDDGNEFVELYNAGDAAVVLDGWSIEYGTSSFSKSIELSGEIEAGGWFVLGDANIVADQTATIALGNAGSSGDALRLVDCAGTVMDTVVYGSDNSDGWIDDSGAEATSIAAKPGGGESLHRLTDGFDTDASADDFCVQELPTPGAESGCPICTIEGRDSIRINELLSNPDGTDGNQEWVELVNLGTEDVSLEAWVLEVGKSSWSPDTIPVGTTIAAGGFLLLAGDGYTGSADVVIDGLDLGNASSTSDGVRLIDCEGELVDSVLYGDEDKPADLDDDGVGSAPAQGDDESIGRYPDGADDDDHAADWHLYFDPTPGEPNTDPAGDTGGGGGDRPGGCCQGNSTDAARPGGGCATAPQAGMWLSALLLGVLLRRRD